MTPGPEPQRPLKAQTPQQATALKTLLPGVVTLLSDTQQTWLVSARFALNFQTHGLGLQLDEGSGPGLGQGLICDALRDGEDCPPQGDSGLLFETNGNSLIKFQQLTQGRPRGVRSSRKCPREGGLEGRAGAPPEPICAVSGAM